MGVGQSSWGPTGFILTDSDTAAHKLTKEIKQNFLCKDLQIETISGRNKGSEITFINKSEEISQNLNSHSNKT